MGAISNTTRSWLAFACWLAGLLLFAGLGWWNMAKSRADAENRLISEAGRTAAQIAGLLSLPGAKSDQAAVKAVISAAMEDEHIYAVKVETRRGLLEGERRNHLWEPMPWDDEIAENCVQGMNPLRIGGRAEGIVEVWLSPRLDSEEEGLLAKREYWRMGLSALAWTCVFIFLFWRWGDFRRLAGTWRKSEEPRESAEEALGIGGQGEESGETPLTSALAGRDFQKSHPDAWLVTAGMFRQTFGKAPALIGRLYAEGQIAGLSHLARMLEQAAPCIGAKPLAEAAEQMRWALNDPDSDSRALSVEKCAEILERTLDALVGDNQKNSAS